MRIKETAIALFTLLLIGMVGFLWLSPGGGARQAPMVSMTTLDGKTVSISDYQGRPILVTFWATTCPGCIKEMPHLVELYEEFGPRGFEVLGIAMAYDEPSHVRETVTRRSLPYTIIHDTEGRAAKAFGDVRLTPTSFLISPDGRIVQEKLGELNMTDLRNTVLNLLQSGKGN